MDEKTIFLYLPFFIFAVLGIACQLIARKTFRSETNWLCTDYAWLAIATLSIGIYFFKANHHNNEVELRQDLANYEMLSKIQTFRLFATNEVDRILGFPEKSANEGQESKRSNDAIVFEKRMELIYFKIQKLGWENFLKFYSYSELSKDLNDPEVIDRTRFVNQVFMDLKERLDKVDKLQERVRGDVTNTAELDWYPILLAIALAIRFGRTTADLLRKREQAALKKEDSTPAVLGPDHPKNLT